MLTDHPGLGEEGGWLRISPPCVETVVVRSRVRALRGDLGLFLCLYPANPVGGQISPQIRNTCREMSHKHRHSKYTERDRLSRPQTCVQMNDICSRYICFFFFLGHRVHFSRFSQYSSRVARQISWGTSESAPPLNGNFGLCGSRSLVFPW